MSPAVCAGDLQTLLKVGRVLTRPPLSPTHALSTIRLSKRKFDSRSIAAIAGNFLSKPFFFGPRLRGESWPSVQPSLCGRVITPSRLPAKRRLLSHSPPQSYLISLLNTPPTDKSSELPTCSFITGEFTVPVERHTVKPQDESSHDNSS